MITKEEAIQYLGNLPIPPMTSNLPKAVTEHLNYIDALRIAQQSLQNEINSIIELEKIKAEIEKRKAVSKQLCRNDYEMGLSDGRTTEKMSIIQIIDNRISELKGE